MNKGWWRTILWWLAVLLKWYFFVILGGGLIFAVILPISVQIFSEILKWFYKTPIGITMIIYFVIALYATFCDLAGAGWDKKLWGKDEN